MAEKNIEEEEPWRRLKILATLTSPWVSVYAEQWCDGGEEIVDYWRVERPDSVIVVPFHRGDFVLPRPIFRPGIGRATWDFPGGRLGADCDPVDFVPRVLERELNVPAVAIGRPRVINARPWSVDSAFSNQRLWGFSVEIANDFELDAGVVGWRCRSGSAGVAELLGVLECLQCRALLLQLVFDCKDEFYGAPGNGV